MMKVDSFVLQINVIQNEEEKRLAGCPKQSEGIDISKQKKDDIILNSTRDSLAKEEMSYPDIVKAVKDSLGNNFEVSIGWYIDCKA